MTKKPPLTAPDVFIRIRPQTFEGGHRQDGEPVAKLLHSWTDDSVTIGWTCAKQNDLGRSLPPSQGQVHTYPRRVFGPDATNDEVYDAVIPPIIDKLLGFRGSDGKRAAAPMNTLLFAYGQTGTGKTHTTVGPDASLREAPADGTVDGKWGCFPRVAYGLFERLEGSGEPFVVAMSAVEFYLACANDLLAFNNPVAVSPDNEPVGMSYRVIRTPADVIPILALARSNRHNRHTRMNIAKSGVDDEHGGSSRGHAMFILTVLQLDPGSGKMVRSAFNMVDMAGAERPDKTGAKRINGDQAWVEIMKHMREGGGYELSLEAQAFAINFELTALASTAKAAADYNKKLSATGQPFHPSATLNTDACRIMGTCMGGHASLSVIVTLSQAPQCGWETWFSCNYGLDLSKLRAPLRGKKFEPVSAVMKGLHRILDDNLKALLQPIKNKAVKWKRLAAIAGARGQLMLIRELLMRHSVPGIDHRDMAAFRMTQPVTTGWVYPGSEDGLQSQYKLEGIWDTSSYNEWLLQFGSSTIDGVEHWISKVSLKEQRRLMDKMVSGLRFDPVNRAWLDRCPAEGPMLIDTSAFPPCDNRRVPVFVHRPADAAPGCPAIVYAHGGAALYCSAKYIESHCARYACENKVVVFNIDYRLAPEHKAPAGIYDAVGVILHLYNQAESLGIDRSRIAVMGESGGGYIAAGAAMELSRRGQSGVLKLCVPLIPQVSDIVLRPPHHEVEGGEAAAISWSWVFKQIMPRGGDPAYVWINRAHKDILKKFPATAIVTAEFDCCRRMGEDLGQRLDEAGTLVEFVCHPGGNHGWNMMMSHPQSDMYWNDIRSILLKHLIY